MKRLLVLLLVAGCYEGNHTPSSGGADDGSASAGEDGTAGGDDTEDSSGGDAACDEALPPVLMRRLSHAEYRYTVDDLFGEGLPDPTQSFPPEAVIGNFDNNRETSEISDVLVERYRDAAELVVDAVLADATRREAIVACESAACLEELVRTFGRRAWRRPLEDDEVARLVALGSSPADPDDAFGGSRAVLEALLQSPNFLYRIEVGTPDVEGRLKLSGYEVASRLSYLVLASTPTNELLDAAESGALDDPDGIEAAARELLADPRAPERLGNFYAQWLDLRRLDDATRDEADYPAWTESLRASMRGEVDRLLREHLLGGADVLDALTAEYAWVDAELAALYGLPAPASGFAPVPTQPQHERGGLLTTAAVLTVTGREGVTTPIIRGRFIREALLCDDLPPPPPDVPVVPDPIEGEGERERLERHRTDPACAGCHALLEPLGYGLARYDAIGSLRDDDVSAEGSFDGSEEPDFDGAAQLQSLLRDDPAVASCLVRHVHRYAFGRVEADIDACTIDQLELAFADAGRSFEELVVALVRSDAFRHREDD